MSRDFSEMLLSWNRSYSIYFSGIVETNSFINYDGHVDEEHVSKFLNPESSSLKKFCNFKV